MTVTTDTPPDQVPAPPPDVMTPAPNVPQPAPEPTPVTIPPSGNGAIQPVPTLPPTQLHQRINNISHALVNLVTALLVLSQLVVEVLHRSGIDTAGADWRLVLVGGGIKTLSQGIDSSYGRAALAAAANSFTALLHGGTDTVDTSTTVALNKGS